MKCLKTSILMLLVCFSMISLFTFLIPTAYAGTLQLWVNEREYPGVPNWFKEGNTPYLNNDTTNWIYSNNVDNLQDYFYFENLPEELHLDNVTKVELYIEWKGEEPSAQMTMLQCVRVGAWGIQAIEYVDMTPYTYHWDNVWDITFVANYTRDDFNGFYINLVTYQTPAYYKYVRRMYIQLTTTCAVVDVSSSPEINAPFIVNETQYNTPETLYLQDTPPTNYSFTTEGTVSKPEGVYEFSYWRINDTTNYYTLSIILKIAGNTVILIKFDPPDCTVQTRIRINDYVPYTNITFQINEINYANNQATSLNYNESHAINGTPVTHLSFINWTTSGDISVDNSTDSTTNLNVTCGGVLTLHLNATVKITHNATVITGMYADNWTFAEERYYGFQTQYILTNSYMDMVKWSFLDFANHNITFYFDNSTNEEVLSGSTYVALRQNGTYSYSWINLTDQTLNVTVWVWVKAPIIDKLYVDLYVWANCTGYGMTNTTDGWVLAGDGYFNIYSKGGLEESFKGYVTGGMPENDTAQAGRITGGDIFNLYCYNDTWAMSEQYWRYLVHTKMLFEIRWDYGTYFGLPWVPPSQDYPPNFHVQVGWTYYARGNWCENNKMYIDLHLYSFGHGADHQFSQWIIQIVVSGTQVYIDDLVGWFDDESKSYKVWLDLWFNKANASSISGARAGSYWYGVENTAEWWKRWAIGNNWGILHENVSTAIAFGRLEPESEDIPAPLMFSSEIELMKLWTRVYQSSSNYNYSCKVWKIHDFDYTYDSNMMGIPTPPFEPPKMPSMPVGGFLGVIYSALMWLAEQLGTGVLMFWNAFVSFLDSVAAWWGYPGFFSNLFSYLGMLWGWFANSFIYLLSFLTSGFLFVFSFIGKLLNTLTTMVSYWILIVQGIFAFFDGAYTEGIHIWNDLGFSYWVILIAILYPVFVFSIWDEKGFDAMLSHVKLVLDILSWMGKLFLGVINLFLNVIGRIIESIPVVE